VIGLSNSNTQFKNEVIILQDFERFCLDFIGNAEDKRLIRHQAYRLAILGAVIERERGKLKRLVEGGVPYGDQKMLQTLSRFQTADSEWKQLEAEHAQLKRKLFVSRIKDAEETHHG